MLKIQHLIRLGSSSNISPMVRVKSSIITQPRRFLRTIPMDSRKIVSVNEVPILTDEKAAECYAKRTMTYSQAIDYIFYRSANPKKTFLKAFFIAAVVGFIVSRIMSLISSKESTEEFDYEAVANIIKEKKTLNPISIMSSLSFGK